MSSGSFLLKRGTASQLSAIVPSLAEPVFSTDTLEFRVGDGLTLGGVIPTNLRTSGGYIGSVREISTTSTYTVQTWAELQSQDVTNLTSGSTFKVLGKSTIGDAGAGRYRYDPTSSIPVIPGLVLAPNAGAGRFLRDYTDAISVVRDMGADNTATTDSTAIIQAALDFAASPTYGWAKDAGTAGQLGLAVELHGAFVTSAPLILKGAVELRGAKSGGRGNDYDQYATIHSKHGGHCIVYDLANDTPYYKLPTIRDINIVGYVETYLPNKKSIVSVTSRLVFAVADADAPTGLDNVSIYAANNVCVFFDNQNACLGTGRIASISSFSGVTTITLEAGTDAYSSYNSSAGNLLTTACKVVFTPKVTEESIGGVTDFYDPASMGCTGIFIKNTSPYLATSPVISNVLIRQCLVGIRYGPRFFGGSPGTDNISIMFCKVAGICTPRAIHTTDFFFGGQLYIHGGTRADFGATGRTNTMDCNSLRYGTYGILGMPLVSKFDRVLVEETSFACVYVSRLILTDINYLLCDGIAGTGLLLGPAYSSYVAPASSSHHSNSLNISSFSARRKLDDGTGWDTIHTGSVPVAIRYEATTISSGFPCYVYLGSAAICTTQNFSSPPPLFPYAFDLGTRSGNNNRLRIGMIRERNGFTLLHKTGTKECELDDRSLLSAAEAYTGWYWDTATSKKVYCNATIDLFSLSSSGVVAGSSGFSGVPLTAVSSTGTVFKLQKTGASPQVYSAVVSTNSLTFKDEDLGLNSLTLFCNNSAIQLWLGSNAGNSGAARSCNLYSENRTGGTDLDPSNLNIVGPGGTGASSANGAVNFYTANPGSSGSSAQSVSIKLQLMRYGQLRFPSLAPLGLGEGDLWFDSTKGFRQYFSGGERPAGPKRVGTATLVAGTATVSLGGSLIGSNTIIQIDSQADGGTPGFLRVSSRIAGTSFTVVSSSNTDTSTFAWSLIEP